MKKHTCLQCGINGYSPDGEIPHEWLEREFHTRAPMLDRVHHRVVVCSAECFADAVYEYESRGSEVEL